MKLRHSELHKCVFVCVPAQSKQAHVAHQKDLPQREGRKAGKKRKEGEQIKWLVMRVKMRKWL